MGTAGFWKSHPPRSPPRSRGGAGTLVITVLQRGSPWSPATPMDTRDVQARTATAAEPGRMSASMSSPEEELAAILQGTGCGRAEVVSFSAINKMFQRQVSLIPAPRLLPLRSQLPTLAWAGAALGYPAFATGAEPASSRVGDGAHADRPGAAEVPVGPPGP